MKFDWDKQYRGNLTWLRNNTIYLTRHGSHAYGTNIESSDLDIKGIAVPPSQYFLGFMNKFEQAESKEPDLVIYDIRKFIGLAADCNPNICEALFTDEEDHLLVTPAAKLIFEKRQLFVTKKAKHTFSGYSAAQMKRIRGHYQWLKNPPPVAPPTRAEFGLPERMTIPRDIMLAAESAIKHKLETWDIDLEPLDPATRILIQGQMASMLAELQLTSDEQYRAAGRSIGLDDNYLVVLDKERSYRARQNDWSRYQEWKRSRNPARAAIEEKFGYDCKHAMHLVRLLRMCREILETGKVIVKRPDRDELLAIRNGAWTYEKLVEWAETEDKALEEVYQKSTLPHAPDRKVLDQLCIDVVQMVLERK